jgi:hypothetical protein
MDGTTRSAQSAGSAPARLAVAVPQLRPQLAEPTRATYRHAPPGEPRPLRSVVPIGLASVIISGCLYAGTELVLALLDRPALLAAPTDVVRFVSQVNEIAPAVLVALGVVVAAAGVALVLVTGGPGRRSANGPDPDGAGGGEQPSSAVPEERAPVAGIAPAAANGRGSGASGSAARPASELSPRALGAAPDRFTAAKAIADALAYDARRATLEPTVAASPPVLQTTP